MQFRRLLVIVSTLFLGVSCGMTTPTGLNAIPTAETLGVGKARFDLEVGNSGKLYVPSTGSTFGVQIGATGNVEIGIDAVSQGNTVYNVKWRCQRNDPEKAFYAIGLQNISPGARPQYYLVATHPVITDEILFGRMPGDPPRHTMDDDSLSLRFHDGVMIDSGGVMLLGGMGVKIGNYFVTSDVIIGGHRDRLTLSAGKQFQNGISVAVTGYMLRNQPSKLSLTIGYRITAF